MGSHPPTSAQWALTVTAWPRSGSSPWPLPSPSDQRSLSYVLRRTDISRTPDSATNTTIATMASPRRGCVPMGWCSTPSPGRGSLVTTTSTWTVETDSTSSPDPSVCHIFYACADGQAEEYTCSSGLWFDEYSGVCNWPETTDRKECKAEAYALETSDGFQCPSNAPTDEFGQFDPHPKYAEPNDYAKFYVCLNGISPREQGCELGLVYNELTKQCDAPENVPECKDYYAFLDEDVDDAKRRK